MNIINSYLNVKLENTICTLIQLMITVLLDDTIMCDLPIKVIKIDEFLSMMGSFH